MFKLQFFKKSKNEICANDFKNTKEMETVNLKYLLSLSSLQNFEHLCWANILVNMRL